MTAPKRLNYQHLLYFWTVVRTGSLAKACAELNLSMPTVSAQLHRLEERLDEQLLVKSGRRLVPTAAGRMAFQYADEIFRLGRELVDALAREPASRPLRLAVGIDDVLPKEIAQRLLAPALLLEQSVRLVCLEGTLERLTAALAVHDLDVVLSDAPVPSGLNVRAYSHRLGSCGTSWMGDAALVKSLRTRFPASLDGASVLLPTDDTALRRALDHWFERLKLRPVVVGEFEDYALLREFARAGSGLIPVPDVIGEQFRQQSGLALLGPARQVEAEFYAITAERQIRHPAVAAICAQAGAFFSRGAGPRAPA